MCIHPILLGTPCIMQCMAGKVFMAAKLNFHQKAVAKEGGRREDYSGVVSFDGRKEKD